MGTGGASDGPPTAATVFGSSSNRPDGEQLAAVQQQSKTLDLVPSEADPLIVGRERDCCDPTFGFQRWMRTLVANVGYKLLVMMFFAHHLLRGFVSSFMTQAQNYLYASYNVPAPQMQIYTGVTALPWALKPIVGLVSDVCPLFGYNKAPYMLIASFLGTLAFAVVGLVPHYALPVTLMVICFILIENQLSVNDILVEAKYAERIRALPAVGPSILTYVWFGMSAGGLVGVALAGVVISSAGPKINFVVCIVPAALIIVPILCGYMEEKRVDAEKLAKVRERFANQKEMCFLCLLIVAAVVALTVCAFFTASPAVNAGLAIIFFFMMLISFSVVLSPAIAMFNAWSLIQSSFSLSTASAAFYFMTDTPAQYPEGPHFSQMFYTTVIGTVGSVTSLLGIMTYEKYLSRWKFRNILLITNIVYSFLSFLDMVLFTRTNLSIGIPDHAFVLSTGVLQQIIYQWQWMPQVIILSYLCPKGMEATMYALLAGCHNLGNTISSNCGAWLLRSLGVNADGSLNESHQFDNLWKASLIASILPLLTCVLLFKLVPDVAQGDKVMQDDEFDATEGSLWKRWTGQLKETDAPGQSVAV